MIDLDAAAIYRQEAGELLDSLEGSLLDLGQTPADRALVDQAFRALHTIKGSGAMFGFDQVAAFADEIFAIDAGMVREITDPVPVTLVAGAKPHLPSVMNVRGNIIPLADIRVRCGMRCAATGADTRIVVIEILIDDEPVVVGIIADKVYEVAERPAASTQQAPRVGLRLKQDYIRSIAEWNDDFVIVPDLERILN